MSDMRGGLGYMGSGRMEHFGIDDRTRREITGTNRIFLSLIRTQAADATSFFGLESAATREIGTLDDADLTRLSCCPFALFSLGFEQKDVWMTLLERQVAEPGVTSWRKADQETNQFLLVALGAVRGASGRDPFLARLLYGIPEDLCRPLSRLDLAALPILAAGLKSRLRARLTGCPGFWQDLLTGICTNPDVPPEAGPIRQLGLQLTLQRALGLRGRRAADPRLCRES